MNQSIRKKAQSGFTLVEVIVVAIIVAALAAVAVPMYTNYVTSSRENAAANAAGSVASFMGACLNQAGEVEGDGIEAGVPTSGEDAITLTCTVTNGPTSTIQLPIGIKFEISKMAPPEAEEAAEPGKVTATHLGGGESKAYNY